MIFRVVEYLDLGLERIRLWENVWDRKTDAGFRGELAARAKTSTYSEILWSYHR